MKLFLYMIFSLLLSTSVFAQDEDAGSGEKIRERMTEYIQKRLGLSGSEASKFAPVFLNYFNELRQTNQTFKGDKLVLQQKVVDLRIRYRDQFKPIMGEKKSNEVFKYEHDFVNEVKQLRQERLQNRGDRTPAKRTKGQLL
ncbi:MAG TPA: hypothetical protein VGB56_04915 [Flavisolibacter sp.]